MNITLYSTKFLKYPPTSNFNYMPFYVLESHIHILIKKIGLVGISKIQLKDLMLTEIEFYLNVDKTLLKDLMLYPRLKDLYIIELPLPIEARKEIGLSYRIKEITQINNIYRLDTEKFNPFNNYPYTLLIQGEIKKVTPVK